MQSFNWGVIGPGNIANTFAKAIGSSKKGKILAVASRSKERASEFANIYRIEKIYSDYEQMLTDPDIDIIYIHAVRLGEGIKNRIRNIFWFEHSHFLHR